MSSSGASVVACCAALVVSLIAAESAQAQGPWQPGAHMAVLLRLDSRGSRVGWNPRTALSRVQTPRVRISAEGGFLWFPEDRYVFVFGGAGGTTVRETRVETLAGPHLSLTAARHLSTSGLELRVLAEVGLGLMREGTSAVRDGPDTLPDYRFVDWEVSPLWAVGSTATFGRSFLGGRPELYLRVMAITLAGDDFVPVLSFGVGWSRDGEVR